MKKKKKQSNLKQKTHWIIPEPTLGDDTKQPEISQHLLELAVEFAKRNWNIKSMNEFNTKFRSFVNDTVTEYNTRIMAKQFHIYQNDILTNQNIVDLRDVPMPDKDNISTDPTWKDFHAYMKLENMMFYALIPCFSTGIYCISENRAVQFRIIDVDSKNMNATMWIMDWTKSQDGTSKEHWNPGVSGTVCYQHIIQENGEPANHIKNIEDDTFIPFTRLYTLISPTELGWNREKCKFWEQVILQNAVDQEARFASHDNNQLTNLAQYLLAAATTCNYIMSKYRTTEIKPTSENQTTTSQTKSKLKDIRRIRTVGLIRFLSENPPKRSTKNTIKQYHVSEWPTRGHTRTLANGKTIWIRPCIHHRKKTVPNAEPLNTVTIKIQNNTKQNSAAK